MSRRESPPPHPSPSTAAPRSASVADLASGQAAWGSPSAPPSPPSGGRVARDADLAAIHRAFSETVDLDCYVPRAVTEALIRSIDQWRTQAALGSTVAALVTQPGMGKTFFLRWVERRINDEAAHLGKPRRAIYIPYASVTMMDLCIWVHGLLGIDLPRTDVRQDPVAALAAVSALAEGAADPFFLMIDDADSMHPDLLRVLQRGLPRENSPLRLLVALNDDAKSSRLLAALDPLEPSVATLRAALSEEETAIYLRTRMRRAGLSQIADEALDADAISRIFALSGGLPREIHRIMTEALDTDAPSLSAALASRPRRGDWLGQPIEDDF